MQDFFDTFPFFFSILFFFIKNILTLTMQHIDAAKIYADGAYRFEYVSKFIDFGKWRV